MTKVVFFDLDGTLLNKKQEIFPQSIEAIQKLVDHNYKVALCTGRPAIMSHYIRELIDRDIDIISSSGAYIELNDRKIEHFFKLEDLYHIIKTIEDNFDITIAFKCPNAMYINKDTDLLFYDKIIAKMKRPDNFPTIKINKLQDIILDNNIKTYKILVFNENLKSDNIQEIAALFQDHFNVSTSSKKSFNLEITPLNINKGTAVQKYLELNNINKENSYCFGDSPNDLEMMEQCANPIAMDNAADIVKQQAKYHVGHHNNEDSISQAIEEIFFQKSM